MDFQFTADELSNLASVALDFFMKGDIAKQTIQDKVLLKKLEASSKAFPGSKELLSWAVKGEYVTTEMGFAGDERVSYGNPAKVKRASARWYNRHAGITVTYEELQRMGIVVTETTTGSKTTDQANAAASRLEDGLADKLEDMAEGRARSRSRMFWLDGSQDAKAVPGVMYWIQDDPTAAIVVGGLDQGLLTWWRNRAQLGIVANAGNASTQVLVDVLQTEFRQATRYGQKPNAMLCGSDFLTQIERELRARGSYTETGWAGKGKIDVSMSDPAFRGMAFEYEPILDDLGYSKRCYMLQLGGNGLRLMHMDGWRDREHNPARPEDRYTLYKAITWTGGMICRQRNGQGVYSIA